MSYLFRTLQQLISCDVGLFRSLVTPMPNTRAHTYTHITYIGIFTYMQW